MCNSIFIDKKTVADAEDGEEVKVMVKAIYRTDKDGVRKLDVESVEGNDVIPPDDGESDCGCEEKDYMHQDAEDALRIFLIKKGK